MKILAGYQFPSTCWEAMQRENGESETGLDKNNSSQQELMLHYQFVSGFFHLFNVPVGSENAKRKQMLGSYLAPGGTSSLGTYPQVVPSPICSKKWLMIHHPLLWNKPFSSPLQSQYLHIIFFKWILTLHCFSTSPHFQSRLNIFFFFFFFSHLTIWLMTYLYGLISVFKNNIRNNNNTKKYLLEMSHRWLIEMFKLDTFSRISRQNIRNTSKIITAAVWY